MKRLMFAATAALACSAGAYQGWNGNAGNGLLSDKGNYTLGKEVAYGVTGGDSNLGGYADGTYTLSADLDINRIVYDKTGNTSVFDLGVGHVLTLKGLEQIANGWAFGVPKAGSDSTLRLTSGTIRVPWAPAAGSQYTNCILKVGRETTATNFTLAVDGASARLEAGKLDLSGGNYNKVVITNGGTVVSSTDVNFGNTSNRLILTGSGVTGTAKNVNLSGGTGNGLIVADGAQMTFSGSLNLASGSSQGNSVLVTGEGSLLKRSAAGTVTVGSSIWGKGARLEVRDGGSLQNITKFILGAGNDSSGNYGHVLAFRDTKTEVELPLTDKIIIGNNATTKGKPVYGCRLEVTDGATLTLNGATKANNRAWIAPHAASHDNGVLVSGAGSKLVADTTAVWLIGQHGYKNTLRVTDGGSFESGSGLSVGQGDSATSKANENAVIVDKGGVLVVTGTVQIGYGTLGQAFSNRLEILSGGIVTNKGNGIRIGSSTNAHYCSFRMDNGFCHDNGHVYVGLLGRCCRMTLENCSVFTNETGDLRAGADANSSPSNAIEVLSGSYLYTKGNFRLCGTGARLTVSNGTVVCRGSLHLPYDNDASGAVDPIVTIAGTNSSISSAGEYLTICRNATLNFILPETGFETPVFRSGTGKALTIKNLKAVTWSIPEAVIDARTEIVLAEPGVGGTLSVDATSLTKLNANLPAECSVRVAGGKLILKAGRRGSVLLVK